MKAADYTNKFLAQMRHYREGLVLFFNSAPIRGIGSSSGFELVVQSRADTDPKHLAQVVNLLIDAVKQNPKIASANTFFRPATPQLFVDVDEAKAVALGVPSGDVFDAQENPVSM